MAQSTLFDTAAIHRAGIPTPARQAYRLLYLAFVLAPIVAGIDKFFHRLTDWSQYLAPRIVERAGIGAVDLMRGVGAVEIALGLLVAVRPRVGAYVVAAWLLAIIVNLFLLGAHLDVALGDAGLLLGALAFGRLGEVYGRHESGGHE
jgi:hypothetical protein